MDLLGGVEAGGTKIVCAVGTGPADLRAVRRFPTMSPQVTIQQIIQFFRDEDAQGHRIAALGVAAFGPLDPNPRSPRYGHIANTPKPGWQDVDIVGPLKEALTLPVHLDTDVNCAALGEWRWGAARGCYTVVYLTVGTGVGGGVLIGGRPLHGLLHPEMGHMRIPHDWRADPFEGACPFHGDCLEGLTCGPAMTARWGVPASALPPDHVGWSLEAQYLGLGLANIICTLSPERVVLGGGVMNHPGLLSLVREQVRKSLKGYVKLPQVLDAIEDYIVAPALGERSGVLGAIALAQTELLVKETSSGTMTGEGAPGIA
jgi:fructokinase